MIQVLGDKLPWQTPDAFKKAFHIPRCETFPLSKIPLVEKALKNVAINVSGDYLYNSGVSSLKRINLTVSNEHISLAKEMNPYNKQVSYKERKPIIYDKATFNAYDGKKLYQMPLNDLYDHYDYPRHKKVFAPDVLAVMDTACAAFLQDGVLGPTDDTKEGEFMCDCLFIACLIVFASDLLCILRLLCCRTQRATG